MDVGAVQGNPRGSPDRQLVRTSQRGYRYCATFWRGTAQLPGSRASVWLGDRDVDGGTSGYRHDRGRRPSGYGRQRPVAVVTEQFPAPGDDHDDDEERSGSDAIDRGAQHQHADRVVREVADRHAAERADTDEPVEQRSALRRTVESPGLTEQPSEGDRAGAGQDRNRQDACGYEADREDSRSKRAGDR